MAIQSIELILGDLDHHAPQSGARDDGHWAVGGMELINNKGDKHVINTVKRQNEAYRSKQDFAHEIYVGAAALQRWYC
ncbi:MAG: hypothetical protein QG604_398 [Candidatus Dependentiae bacterium]|nr:hypothetical protein [Candidatus Dependentiae bacterium]